MRFSRAFFASWLWFKGWEVHYNEAAFISPVSVEVCEICCSIAGQIVQGFEVTDCISNGCNLPNDEEQCEDVKNFDNDEKIACEVGRDLRLSGITEQLIPTKFFKCITGGVTPELVEVEFNEPEVFEGANATTCAFCCDDMNERFDIGDVGGKNDHFGVNACQDTCVSNRSCFNESSHRERLGCLVALDFRTQFITQLDEAVFQCLDNGLVVNIVTDAPTLSPTEEADIADEDDLLLIAAGAVGGGGLISILLLSFHFALRARRNTRRSVQLMETRTDSTSVKKPSADSEENKQSSFEKVVFEIQLPPAAAPSDGSSITTGNSYNQDSLARHVMNTVQHYVTEKRDGSLSGESSNLPNFATSRNGEIRPTTISTLLTGRNDRVRKSDDNVEF